jgi:HPt (histidine-containing phosphotransfer) domain-containing protein
MTADTTPAHQERALAAGMSDHLSKPVDVHALFAKLARWVPGTGARAPTPAASVPAAAAPAPLRRSMLARFCDEYRDFAVAFATAQAAPQADAALRLAHTLKGVAGNLGLTDIAQSADALETACRNDSDELTLTTLATGIHTQIAALDAAGERLTAPATEPAPCCEIPAMDPQRAHQFRALAARLQALLDDGDAEALEVAGRLVADIATDSELGRRLAVLRQRIEEFEFVAAANDLRALQDPLSRLGKEAPDEPAPTPTPTTTALTDRLADLLDSDDTDAGTVAEALVQALESWPQLAATARQIAHRVDEFDYTAARTALAELRRKQAQEADGDR